MARRSVTIVASDGKRERVSWYTGATEAAVLRCALLALGLPASGGSGKGSGCGTDGAAAHLLWPSGDAVDFGTPIPEGVTLHLDTTELPSLQNYDDDDDGGGGGGLYSVLPDDNDSVDRGGFSGGVGGNVVAHRRASSSGANTAAAATAAGGRDSEVVTAPRRGLSITAPLVGDHHSQRRRQQRLRRPSGPVESSPSSSSSSLAKRRALLKIRRFFGVQSGGGGGGLNSGMFRRFIDRTTSAATAGSDEELERRPLLGIGRVSSATSLLSLSSSSAGGGGGGGARRRERGAGADNEVDGDGHNPDHQRTAILKLKRINAYLANERTLLAWVRCVGKMFTVGVLCLTFADESGGGYALYFLGIGVVYFSMGPYVVYIGSLRYNQAEEVMRGSPHEAYEYFSGTHLRSLTILNAMLAALTVALMVNQLLATLGHNTKLE
ncbi:unnamed protein product [Pylaiella littoralis]